MSVWGSLLASDSSSLRKASFVLDNGTDSVTWEGPSTVESPVHEVLYFTSSVLPLGEHSLSVTNVGTSFSLALFNISFAVEPDPPATSDSMSLPSSIPRFRSAAIFSSTLPPASITVNMVSFNRALPVPTSRSFQGTTSTQTTPSGGGVASTSPLPSTFTSGTVSPVALPSPTALPAGQAHPPVRNIAPSVVCGSLVMTFLCIMAFVWWRRRRANAALGVTPFGR